MWEGCRKQQSDPVSTQWIRLIEAGHTSANTQLILMTDNGSVPIVPEFDQIGLGDFCFGGIRLPSNLTDGTNATIQIIQAGDGTLLYQCADITVNSTASRGQCNNGTGVMAAATTGNVSGSSSSAGASATGSAAAATSTAAGNHLPIPGLAIALAALAL